MTSGRHMHSSAGRRGVTLVELMVVLAIFSIITGLIYGIFISQIRSKSWQDQVFETQQNVRGAMDLMVSEMRKADTVNAVTGDCAVIGAGSTSCSGLSFRVWSREEKDNELITYYTTGTPLANSPVALMRSSKFDKSAITAVATVAENITEFNITCFDQTGNEMFNIAPSAYFNIRKARIIVSGTTGRPNPNTGDKVSRTLVSTIEFRNAWRYSGAGCGILNFRVTPNTVAFCSPPGDTAEIGLTLSSLSGAPMGGLVKISPKLSQPISITGSGISPAAAGIHEVTVPASGESIGSLMVNDPSSAEVRAGTSIELVAKWQPADCSYAIATSRALGIKAGYPYLFEKGYGSSIISNATLFACSDDHAELFVKLFDNCENLIKDEVVTFTIVGTTDNPDTSKGGIINSNSDPVLRYVNKAEEKSPGWYNATYEAGDTAQVVTIEAFAAGIVLPANQKISSTVTLVPSDAARITVTSMDAGLSSLEECPGKSGTIAFQVQDACSNPISGQAGNIELGLHRKDDPLDYFDTGVLSLEPAGSSDLTYSFVYNAPEACGEGGTDKVRIALTNSPGLPDYSDTDLTVTKDVNLIQCELPAVSISITEKKTNDEGLNGLPGGCNDDDRDVKVTATVTLENCEPANVGSKVKFTVSSPTVGRNAAWAESGDDEYTTAIQNVPGGAGSEFVAHLRGGNALVGDTLTITAVAEITDFGGATYDSDPETIEVIGSSALVKFYADADYASETTRYDVPKLTTNETGYIYAQVVDCNRNHDSGFIELVSLNLESDNASEILNSVPFPLSEVNLTTGAPAPNSGVFRTSIPMKRTAEIGKLLVDKGGIITASYIDADNPGDTEDEEAVLSGCRQMRIKNLAGSEIGEVDPKKPYPGAFPDDPPHTFHVEVDVPYYKNGIINSGSSDGLAIRTCADEARESSDAVGLSEEFDDLVNPGGTLKVSQSGVNYVYVLEGADNPESSGLEDALGVWVTYSPQHMRVYYPDISSTCDDTLDEFIDEGCSVEVYLADVDQPSVVLSEPCAEEITPAVQNSVTVNFTASDGATGFINSATLWRETADSFGTCNPVGNATIVQSYNSTNYPSIDWGGAHNIGILNTVDLSALIDGVYAIYAKATDNEGNTGTSNICCLTKDVMPPGVMINSPDDGSTVPFTPENLYTDVLDDPYTLDYTFIANDLTVGLDNAVVYLKESATSTMIYAENFDYNGETSVVGAGDFDVTALDDGWYNIYVTAWDEFRNSSTSDTSYKVLLNRLGAWLWEPSGNALINGATEYFEFGYWDGPGGTVTDAVLFVNSVAAKSYTPNDRQGIITGTFDTTAFSDGDYEVKVWVKDNDGNTAFSNASTVSIDNTLPGVTLNLPLNGALINNTLSYQFTATDNRALVNSTVYLTETADGTLHTFSHAFGGVTSVTQNGSFDTSAYDDGPYTIYVRVWDEHGNSMVSATHNIMIDRLRALLYLPADNAIVNGPAVPFQFEYWDGPAGSLADFRIYASDGAVDYLVFDSPVGNPGNNAVISGSFDSRILSDGIFDFYVEVIDNDGNSLDSPMNLNIRVKNNPPDRPVLIEPVNGAEFVMNTVDYHFTGSDAVLGIDNSVIHLYSIAASSDTDTDAFTYPLNSFNVNTTGFFNTTTYNDGPYEVWVDVYDRLGNMNASAPHHAIMVDRMRAMLNTPADGLIINGPAYGYDFFYWDGLGGTVTNATLIINSAAGVQTNVASYTPNLNSGHESGAFDTGAYADGLYDLIVKVIDNHSNIKYSNRNGVRIKNTPPAIVLDIPAGNVTVTNALAYQATATDNVIGIREISVILTNTASGAVTLSSVTPYPAFPIGSTVMSGSFDTSAVADGQYRIRATTEDRVGNPATSVVRDVMVNRLTATMIAPVTGDILNGTAANMRVNGVDGSYSFSYWDGTNGRVVSATVYARSQSTGIATAVKTHVFAPQMQTDTVADKFDTTALADGLYDIYVTVTDNDGNTFTSATNTGIRIKNSLPTTITLNTPLDGAKVGNTVSYDFTANDVVLGIRNVTAYFYEVATGTTQTAPYNYAPAPNTARNESSTFDATALIDGYYDVYADAYDEIWNKKRSNINRVMLDRLNGTLTSPATGTIINGTAVTFSINGAASTYTFAYADGPGGTVTNATVRLVDAALSESTVGSFTPNNNSGTVNDRFNTTAHADGLYSMYVQLRDNNANIVNTNTNTSIRIKNTPPTVVLNTPAADTAITNSLAYEATGYDAAVGISEVSVILTNTATGAVTMSSVIPYANISPAVNSGTFNTSGVDDGRYRIRATAEDAINTPASSATRNVMVNRLTATMLTPATGAIVNGIMSFSFYYYDGAGGTVTDAEVYARPLSGPDYILGAYTPGIRTGTITDSIDTNGAADGLYDIFVTVTDNDGNTFTSASNTGVRVKNDKPYLILHTPADGAKVGSSVDYLFSANDNTLGIDNAIAYFSNATSTLTQAYDYSPAVANTPIDQSGTFNAAGVVDGLYDVYVEIFDPIGNMNTTAHHTVMLDRLAGTMVDPAAGAVINSAGANFRINGVIDTYSFSYADGLGGTVTNAAVILVDSGSAKSTVGMHVLGANSGTATGTFDTAAHADGLYSIYAQMRDDNGNIVNTTTNLNVRIKNAKPGITLDIPAGNVTVSNSLAYQATGTDNVIGISNITVYLVNTVTGNTTLSSGTNYANPTVPTAKAGTLDTTAVLDGRYYINASADDAVGNRQFSAISRDVMVNRLNAIMNTPAESAIINGPSVPVSYFYFDGLGGTVTNAAIYARDTMANVYEVDSFNPGNRTGWASRTIDTTGATDGLYDFYVKVWDNDGNVYTSASHSVRVKNNPPTVTLNTPLDGAIFNGALANSVAYDFTANDEDLGIANATVYFYDLTALSVALTNDYTYAPIPNNPVNQSGTLDTSGLNDGPYSVYVTVGDQLGNTNTSAPAHSVMLDRLAVNVDFPPAGTWVQGIGGHPSNVNSYYSFTVSDGPGGGAQQVDIYLRNTATGITNLVGSHSFGPTVGPYSDLANYDSSYYANGNYEIYAVATDNHGNMAESARNNIDILNNCQISSTWATRYSYYDQASDYVYYSGYFYINWWAVDATMRITASAGAYDSGNFANDPVNGYYWKNTPYVIPKAGIANGVAVGNHGVCTATKNYYTPVITMTTPTDYSVVKGPALNYAFNTKTSAGAPGLWVDNPFNAWLDPAFDGRCTQINGTMDFNCSFSQSSTSMADGNYFPYIYVYNHDWTEITYKYFTYTLDNCWHTITVGGPSQTATINANSCDTDSNGAYEEYYMFTVASASILNVQMTFASGTVDPYIELYSDADGDPATPGVFISANNDGGGAPNARLTTSMLSPGTYYVKATTAGAGQTGTATVSVTVANCMHDLALSTPTVGTLSAANSCDIDADGKYEEWYKIVTVSSMPLRITESAAPTFDTYLYFYDSNMNLLYLNDDYSGVDSQIDTGVLAAGTYYAKASSYAVGATGNFTITASPSPCYTLQTLTLGAWAADTLTCDMDADGLYDEYFKFTLTGNGLYQMDMVDTSGGMIDPYIYLMDASFNILDQNDDGGGFPNARLVKSLNAGTYYIKATDVSWGAGSFNIRVNEINYIVNGGFETGDFTGWAVQTSNLYPQISAVVKDTGNFAAFMGDGAGGMWTGVNPSVSAISQNITVPVGAVSPTLAFRYYIPGYDGPDYDGMEVLINGVKQGASIKGNTGGWVNYSLNLAPWANGALTTVRIQVYTKDAGVTVNYYVDNVRAYWQ